MAVEMLVNFAGALIFLFLFWKRLKEDYVSEMIFTTAFYVIFGIIFAVGITLRLLPPFWFWGGTVGALIGLGLGLYNFKLKFFETFEAFAVGLLAWLALFLLASAVAGSNPHTLLFDGVVWVLLILSYYADTNYKNFAWYRSGRVGFTGLALAGSFFLARAMLALPFPFMITSLGRADALISAPISFIFFLILFNYGRKN